MSTSICLACGADLHVRSTSCPGCGVLCSADTRHARRMFQLAAGIATCAVIAPFLMPPEAQWVKLLSLGVLAVITVGMAWIIPAVVEGKRRQQHAESASSSREYKPTRFPR